MEHREEGHIVAHHEYESIGTRDISSHGGAHHEYGA